MLLKHGDFYCRYKEKAEERVQANMASRLK